LPNDDNKLVLLLEARLRKFEKQMDKSTRIIDKNTKKMNRTWARGMKRMERSAKGGVGRINGLLGALGVGLGVRSVVNYADAWTEAGNKIKAAESVFGGALASVAEIGDIASDSRQKMEPIADLYARLARASGTLGKSQEEVARTTALVAKAFKASGATQSEQESAILQLTQGIASGALQGDELRTVRESAPIVAKAIADAFDVPIGKLKELGAQGKITADIIFDAVLSSSNEIEEQFGATLPTVGDALERIRTEFGRFISGVDDGTGASQDLVQVLMDIADFIPTMTQGLISAALSATTFAKEGSRAFGELYDRLVRLNNIKIGKGFFDQLADNSKKTSDQLFNETLRIENQIDSIFNALTDLRAQESEANQNQAGRRQNPFEIISSQHRANKIREFEEDRKQLEERLQGIYTEQRARTAANKKRAEEEKAARDRRRAELVAGALGTDRDRTKVNLGTTISKEERAKINELKKQRKIEQDILVQQFKDAEKLYQDGLKPVEVYYNRLFELSNLQANSLVAQAAGGDETFAQARIQALTELAEETDNYAFSIQELNKLADQGLLTSDQVREGTQVLREALQIEKKELDEIQEKLKLKEEARERQYQLDLEELEIKLELAELAGRNEEAENIARQIALLVRRNELLRRGVSDAAAQQRSKDDIDAFEAAENEGKIRDFVKAGARAGFRDGIDGIKDYLGNTLSRAADKMFDNAIDTLLDAVFNGLNGSGGGGILGGIAGGITKLLGFADGGPVRGPGGPTSDSILARVSNGEYIVPANAAKGNYDTLEAMRSGSNFDQGFRNNDRSLPSPVSAPALNRVATSAANDLRARMGSGGTVNMYYTIEGVDTEKAFSFARDEARRAERNAKAQIRPEINQVQLDQEQGFA